MKLVVYSSERLAKEIAIHRVHGANENNLMELLNKDFIKLVAVAFMAASPLGRYVMNKWLHDFAYRIDMSWWMFVLASVFALAIAVVTVSWQAIRAVTANPVESLRYE